MNQLEKTYSITESEIDKLFEYAHLIHYGYDESVINTLLKRVSILEDYKHKSQKIVFEIETILCKVKECPVK